MSHSEGHALKVHRSGTDTRLVVGFHKVFISFVLMGKQDWGGARRVTLKFACCLGLPLRGVRIYWGFITTAQLSLKFQPCFIMVVLCLCYCFTKNCLLSGFQTIMDWRGEVGPQRGTASPCGIVLVWLGYGVGAVWHC